ncbi:precorrin-6A/cobalt-precorrin-6A reductase [Marmoricola sp. OAE513]|uniref:cobalt-precorrin-6A reductase n=1 Tax=Marmoricola sp. OAE513 TaxID=2817894 RepID=UPI001AE1C0AD
MRVLLLGGTGEARDLAVRLVDTGVSVTSSLAGRVARPQLPVGEVRTGGFGGVEGLRAAAREFDLVVDATHPFAAGISANAAAACPEVLLRLQRPGWEPEAAWEYVDTHAEAARTAASSERPLLTIGRQALAEFVPDLRDHAVLARVVDEPDQDLPETWELLRDRGPYTVDGELALMRRHGTDVLVTKDSGGGFTRPKLDAAAAVGARVVVVRRPPAPAGVRTVTTVDEVVAWIEEQR